MSAIFNENLKTSTLDYPFLQLHDFIILTWRTRANEQNGCLRVLIFNLNLIPVQPEYSVLNV